MRKVYSIYTYYQIRYENKKAVFYFCLVMYLRHLLMILRSAMVCNIPITTPSEETAKTVEAST